MSFKKKSDAPHDSTLEKTNPDIDETVEEEDLEVVSEYPEEVPDNHDHDHHSDDSIEYEIYYDKKEIDQTIVKQNNDTFKNLVGLQKKVIKEQVPEFTNFINIEDYLP